MKLVIYHNIMWARYKAAVFSVLYRQTAASGVDLKIYQIAETESDRVALSPVDTDWHSYPYELLFKGAYSSVPKFKLVRELARRAWADEADLTILTGYERPEIWIQALILFLRHKRFAWFCDSTVYDNPQTTLRGLAKRVLFWMADGIFCYGQRSQQYLSLYGVPNGKIFIRRQAAALPQEYSKEAVLRRRAASASSPERPRYLYVGRLSPEKSIEQLFLAFSKVVAQYPFASLVVVGRGPQENALRRLADQLGISSSVEFAGAKFDEALIDEYYQATCLVLPSRSEPWGLVVNESLSYGCPAIVNFRCGCVPELIIDGITGHSFEDENIQDLTEKLLAAPAKFKDSLATARSCLDKIAEFTPIVAGAGILRGAATITGRDSRAAKLDKNSNEYPQ
ncbi:Glycosyltransferase involved in cell wall bisynthesis [Bradyrhizobium sp. Rc2d]|uniref:glycosyltransferase n=1 Tax=Bradyrhizobium sp. Rc2d TaxID=1855321 RepID=UPI00087E451A|nr:glycosyltransferase [Bradyrhizobium sp. Rc2d]SDH20565.1 Glycosyltransferase involved in cell wall bisynthesis [Bradyrhizobium sp. Rc2d]